MVNGWVKLLVCYKALFFKFAKLEWSLYKCPLNIKRPLCLKVAKLGTLAAIREYMFFLLNVRLRSKLLFFVTTVVCSICKVSFAWKFPGYVKRSDVPYWFQGQVFKGQGKTANVCLIFKDLFDRYMYLLNLIQRVYVQSIDKKFSPSVWHVWQILVIVLCLYV